MKSKFIFYLSCLTIIPFCTTSLLAQPTGNTAPPPPLKIGVAGLTHGHVGWILNRKDQGDIEVTGIYEPNQELAKTFSSRFNFDMDIVYDDLDEMLTKTNPDAVTAFNPISEHRMVVEACAPRGIHVMVEKPLAFSKSDADRMAELARKHKIHLLTNYETSWYPTTHKALHLLKKEKGYGDVRKLVIRDGHQGPQEIGVGPEFLEWLIDPEKNGGGAIIDFGCYGANLATWFMEGQKPISVTAVTQQMKPHIYPEVDDEATILLTYPKAIAVIQASWNWPFNRKDMDIYGATGYIKVIDRSKLVHRSENSEDETEIILQKRPEPLDDPFSFLAAVIRGEVNPEADLSALELNLVVVEILDAARQSARENRTVFLR